MDTNSTESTIKPSGIKNTFNIVNAVLLIVGLLVGYYIGHPAILKESKTGNVLEVSYANSSNKDSLSNLPIKDSAICEFKRISSAEYDNPKTSLVDKSSTINFQSSEDKESNKITFVDLTTDSPKVVGNAGQDKLLKIRENEESVSLLEIEPMAAGTVIIYTLFKKEKVATWTKQYKLLFIPYAHVSMGYCIGA